MCRKILYAAFLTLCLTVLWNRREVVAQSFPYNISVETVSGHCYDDGHLIFTILDGNGNVVQIDPQTHNAVNTAQYPLYNVQYHYQNAASGLGVQYDYSNDIMLTAGTYNVGVRVNIPAQSGGYVLVDTTIYNVQITTSYQPMQASTLSNLCSGYGENGAEMYGYWPSFRCKDMGRIQLYITNGSFPYVVTILNEQQDTVRHVVFNHRVNNSNSIYSAQYRDYYTFDNLPIGTYSIIVMDSCGYVSQLSFDIPDYEPIRYYALVPTSNSVCSDEPVINFELERRRSFSDYSTSWFENVLPYVDSILLYRFVNPGHDTTEWRNMVSQIYNYGHWVYFNDTLPNYCVMYNDTIKVQFYDLCLDSLMTFSFKFLPQFDFIDSTDIVHFSDSAIQDTCAVHLLSGFSTQTYKIACDTWEDANKTYYGGSGYVAGIPIRYYNCPLSYDIWSLPDSTLLGHSQSDEFTGMGTWLTFDVDTSVQVHVSVTDALGCQVAEKDTVLVYDVEPVDDLLFWYECHNDKDDDGHDHCCLDRYLWIQEHGVNANNFRRNMTLHLIESPLYNQFNFTAVRQEGVWTVTPDDSNNHTTYVEFSYEDGWRATVRDSVCLPPGRYTFVVSTDCGVDTITYSWAGYYYDTLDFVSAPQYEIQQVCDHIEVTQVSTGLMNYMYFMDPDVSNDIPIETVPNHVCTNYSSQGGTHYKDSQGRNVITFTIPGTYIITNYAYNWPYTNCTDWCSEYHYYYDTITVAFSHLDFNLAVALLCDSSSEAGTVSVRAVNGNPPYTYTLYDQGSTSGNVIASNSSGLFENVPMTEGQLFSVSVTDSCMTSFSVNISASVLTDGNLLWEQGANAGVLHCAGDTVHLTALSFLAPATYQWTGPNGFNSTSQTNDIVLPYNGEEGWYTVEILNSFCGPLISDSIYIPVAPSPVVTIFGDSIVCPGSDVMLSFVPQGYGQVSFDVFHPDGRNTFTVNANDTLTQYYPVLSSSVFWVDHIVDDYCPNHAPIDSFYVGVYALSPEPTDFYDTICQGSDYNANGFTLTAEETDTAGTLTRTRIRTTEPGGCIDTVTLHLWVISVDTFFFAQSVCESFIWNGETYYESDSYTQSFSVTDVCDSIVTLLLTIEGPPVVSVTVAEDTICKGASTMLSAEVGNVEWLGPENSDAVEYLWSNGSAEPNIFVTLEESSLFTVTVTVNGECSDTAEAFVTVRNTIHLTDTTYLCENDSVTLTAQHSPPFLWSTGDTTQSITVSETGDYIVSLLDVFGCYYDSTIHVSLIPAIPVTPLFVTVLENELPYTLNDSTYQTEGSYTQTLTSTVGCDSVLTIELSVLYNIHVFLDSTICENELPFSWNDSVFLEAGTIITIIPASSGVDSIISMTLHARPIPPAQISGSSVLCPDSSGTISVDSAVTYLWSSGDTTQSITVNTSGHYSVTVTDEYGCVNTANHKVMHVIVNPIDTIRIPEACAGSSDTVVVGRSQESQILIGQYDTIPLLSDAVIQSDNILTAGTEVSLVEVEGPWMESVGDTMFVISVPADLSYDTMVTGIIHLYNMFGCGYDTTVVIVCHSRSQSEFDTTVCDLFIWNGDSYTTTGQYTQTLDNANGCDSVVTVNLTVNYTSQIYDTLVLVQNQLPYYFAPTDTTFGVNSASTVAFSYWRTNDQGCDTLCNQAVIIYQNTQHAEDTTVCASALPFTWHGHIFTDAGSHTDTLLTIHGSDSVCTYTLIVDLLSASVNSPTHIVCYGASTGAASAVVTGGTAPLSYQWTGISGTTVSTSVQVSNQPAGFYTFTVSDQLGCSATDTVTLRTLNGELLPGSIEDNQDVCEGDFLAAFIGTAASGGDNSVYQWQFSSDNINWGTAPGASDGQDYNYPNEASTGFHLRRAWISQSCGTVYSNTVTVTVGVNSRDTIRTQVCQNTPYTEFGFDISADETAQPGVFTFEMHYAAGTCDSVIVLMLTVNAPSSTELSVDECGSYVWNGVTYYESGSYEQTLINAAGCDSLVQLQLTLLDTEVEIVPLTENFCEEMFAELSVVTELTDYLWSTGEEGPNITVTVPGTYSVTASQGDCRNSASYTISPCEFQVFMPNAITPSRSDGQNDWFFVPATTQSLMHSFEISIFNRWGEQVFYSTDKNFRWNGEVKGKIFYNTVYTYIIRYTDANGKPHYVNGSVIVL